jgi:hypothetical protein
VKLIKIITLLLLLPALAPSLAWALELKDYSVVDDAKKITISFNFSSAVKDADFEVVSNYQGNFIALKLKGLKFSNKQLKTDIPAKKGAELFYRFLRFTPGDASSEVRVYLAKPVTPADVLTELREAKATLEIVKPWWKLPGAQPPSNADEAKPEFIPDTAEPNGKPEEPAAQPDSIGELPPPGEGFRDVGQEDAAAPPADETGPDQPPADGSTDETGTPDVTPPDAGPDESAAPPDTATGGRPAKGEIYSQTGVGEIFGHGDTGGRESKPARESKPQPESSGAKEQPRNQHKGPGYTEFDLDQIPISGIEIRGLPFDEAILKLVASSGFNVVVGKDVDSTEVNLNFTQKQISLKNALDLLCIAYDLTYTVEADAIVIKGKS